MCSLSVKCQARFRICALVKKLQAEGPQANECPPDQGDIITLYRWSPHAALLAISGICMT